MWTSYSPPRPTGRGGGDGSPRPELLGTVGLGRTMVGLVVTLFVLAYPPVAALLEAHPYAFADWTFYADAVALAGLGVFGATVLAMVVATTVPRLLQLAVKPDTVYPLYGLRDAAARAVARLTNSPMLGQVFGDSSYVVNYVRAIGHHQPQVEQTGSNLGLAFKHDTPFLSTIGTGTMIADGLSFMNADYSATSFKVSRAAIGAHNFLGNAFPSRPGPGPGTTACSRPWWRSPSTDRCATTWACSGRRRSRSPARSCGTRFPRSMRAVPAFAGTSRPRTGTTCAPSRS